MKVVIIGGVAGGATAAARLRRLDEQAEIVVFERSGYVSYANCGLPYYIGGVIEAPESLTLQTPESFFDRFRVDMRVRHEVTALHPDRKTVSVKNLETGEEFEEGYDKLILSPGARPTQPRLPGVGLGKVFTLRTGDMVRHVPVEEILFFETASAPHHIFLHTPGSRMDFLGSLNELEYHQWDAYSRDGRLIIEIGDNETEVSVYGVDGMTWLSGEVLTPGEHTFDLPKGLFIVVSGDFARRVLVK